MRPAERIHRPTPELARNVRDERGRPHGLTVPRRKTWRSKLNNPAMLSILSYKARWDPFSSWRRADIREEPTGYTIRTTAANVCGDARAGAGGGL